MKLRKYLFASFLLMLICPHYLSAQYLDTLWTKTHGYDIGEEKAFSVGEDFKGGYIVAGGFPAYTGLVRTDATGDSLWYKHLSGGIFNSAFSVCQVQDSGYIVAGYVVFSIDEGSDLYLIRTDSLGEAIWSKRYGGEADEIGYCIEETPDRRFIVAGYTNSFGAGNRDVYLVKIDETGDTVWTKTYGGIDVECGYSVQHTSDGGYIIAGLTWSFGEGGGDVYLIKTDSLGDTLWTRTYGGPLYDYGHSVQETFDGGYIITGITWSYGAGDNDVYLIRTDENGATLWTETYGGIDNEYGYSVQQTSDSGFIIAGSTKSYGAGDYDVYLIKTDSDGGVECEATYGGQQCDEARSVRQTSDGGYIVAGYTYSFGAGYSDMYLLKIAPETGISSPKANEREVVIPRILCSPNPFCRKMEIQINGVSGLSVGSIPKLRIFDITGRMVREIFPYSSSCILPTIITWDGTDNEDQAVPGGIYFVEFQFGEERISKKVVKIE
jgi:hypothetical protein